MTSEIPGALIIIRWIQSNLPDGLEDKTKLC
jgi:hypothetical protein